MRRLNKLDGWVRDCTGFLAARIWIALMATAMTVAIPTITFAQTSRTATESEPAAGGNASPVQGTSGTEDDTSVETDPRARPATPGAVEEEIQSRFNDLRSELLDDRAGYIDWWLAALAVVLGFFAIVAVVGGYIGFRRFQEIETDAKNSVKAAAEYAEAAKRHVEEIERNRDKSDEILRRMNAETAADEPEKANQAVKDARENPKASLTDKAIANALDLQRQERNKEAIEKWRAIASIAEGTDNKLAARAWFSVGYLLQDDDPEGSMSAYSKSIRLKPDSYFGYNNRGNAKQALGRHEDAIADYNEAIRLKPDLAGAYSNRGNPKAALGRHEDAIADYNQAILLKPDYAKAYMNRGVAKRALGLKDEARKDFETALGLVRNANNADMVAQLKQLLRDLDDDKGS